VLVRTRFKQLSVELPLDKVEPINKLLAVGMGDVIDGLLIIDIVEEAD